MTQSRAWRTSRQSWKHDSRFEYHLVKAQAQPAHVLAAGRTRAQGSVPFMRCVLPLALPLPCPAHPAGWPRSLRHVSNPAPELPCLPPYTPRTHHRRGVWLRLFDRGG